MSDDVSDEKMSACLLGGIDTLVMKGELCLVKGKNTDLVWQQFFR